MPRAKFSSKVSVPAYISTRNVNVDKLCQKMHGVSKFHTFVVYYVEMLCFIFFIKILSLSLFLSLRTIYITFFLALSDHFY